MKKVLILITIFIGFSQFSFSHLIKGIIFNNKTLENSLIKQDTNKDKKSKYFNNFIIRHSYIEGEIKANGTGTLVVSSYNKKSLVQTDMVNGFNKLIASKGDVT